MTHYSLPTILKVLSLEFIPTAYEPTHKPRSTADGSEPADIQSEATLSREYKEFTRDQRVIDFAHAHKLTLGRKRQWYWCSNQENKDGTPRWGAIIGLGAQGDATKDANDKPIKTFKLANTRGIPRIK